MRHHRMRGMRDWLALASLLVSVMTSPQASDASCGQAVCTLAPATPSERPVLPWQLRLDAQMEYIEQDQSWVGYHGVEVGAVPRPDHAEVETTNFTWRLRADLAVDEHWSFSVVLPIVHREHLHLATESDGAIPDAFKKSAKAFKRHAASGETVTIGDATGVPERWNFTNLGDMEIGARYSLASVDSFQDWRLSLFAGLKLPSGETGVRNDDGEEAEITLQPGTGSVDPLLGVLVQRSFAAHDLRGEESRVPIFAGVTMRSPGSNGRFGYRPGLEALFHLGAVYPVTKRVELLGQINYRYKDRDHVGDAPGVPAEHTGGETLHLSPGIRLWVLEATAVYGYCQVPVLRRVNGIQLVSDWNLLFGITHEFNL